VLAKVLIMNQGPTFNLKHKGKSSPSLGSAHRLEPLRPLYKCCYLHLLKSETLGLEGAKEHIFTSLIRRNVS